ncbi:MAG TPA: hydrolase TatD [Chloroflexi bacterium]|nr:hydrolase TatD [Chloroflexota bacterium]HBY09129.1 hydrolase TatD [Chloroflexota bacterium]
MTLTDTHCHLDFRDFDVDRDAVLARAWEAGLERILIPGIDLQTSQAAIELAESDPRIYAAVGVHPNSATLWDAQTLEFLSEMAAHPKVAAIGEIGLDYYRERAPRSLQKQVFREQLNLAGRLNLPVAIHTRNASDEDRLCITETLEILAEFRGTGVLHSFSGNLVEAERTLELGFFIGITGPVTFKKADELRMVVSSVPLDRLLIETDSPFLTPHPHRGQRNEPVHVRFVAEKICEIHNQSPEVVAEVTTANARRLFQWSN